MSPIRQISRGLRALLRRDVVRDEIADEVRDYFERARQDLIEQGVAPDEAANIARQRFGEQDRAREDLQDYGWEHAVEATLVDGRYALRRLRRSPGFALVAMLTLAIGIGSSTAIFSAIKPILIEPLPYPVANRIVELADRDGNGAALDVTYGTFLEVAARSRSFDSLAVADRWSPSLVGGADPEQLSGDYVSAGYFSVLGVAPASGRDFAVRDDVPGAPPVAIVTAGLAERRFGTAAAGLDAMLELDGIDYRVVGIMPRDFENLLAPAVEVWAPRRYRDQAPFESAEWGHHMRMVGRLAAGVPLDQARAELTTIGGAAVDEFPRPDWALFEQGLDIAMLQDSVTAGVRSVLWAITGSVVLLLLLACANVTNLLLARSVRRRSELAVRAALGAGRGRLVRQLLTESLCLAGLGGMLALPVAWLGIESVVALAPAESPRVDAIRFDLDVFLIALLITTLVGLVVGLAPALSSYSAQRRIEVRAASRVTSGGHHILRRGLVVSEIALALVLSIGAGLMYRSVSELLSTPTGFDSADRLSLQIVAPSDTDLSPEGGQRYFDALLAAVGASPGVIDAALVSQLPLSGDFDSYGIEFESAEAPMSGQLGGALRYVITPDWLRTMNIPLLEGRLLDQTDRAGAPQAVLLNQAYADRRFAGRSPIGERLRIGPDMGQADRPWGVVVGVVGDVKHSSLELAAPPAFYIALGQWPWVDRTQSLVVHGSIDPERLTGQVADALRSVDPAVVLARVSTMDDLLDASEAKRRFTLTLFLIFAVTAVVLAAFGLYGVMSGSVEERTREIGLRSALGASPRHILSVIVRQGLLLTTVGVAIGAVGAVAATRALRSLLFNIAAVDPLTYLSMTGLIFVVTLAACWIPAYRAAKVDPTHALRVE